MRTKTITAPDRRQTSRIAPAWTALAAERSAAAPVTGGQTLLKLDSGTAAALSETGISIRATGPAIGPADSPVFAFPIESGRGEQETAQRQNRAFWRTGRNGRRYNPSSEAIRDRPR